MYKDYGNMKGKYMKKFKAQKNVAGVKYDEAAFNDVMGTKLMKKKRM